MNYQISAEPMTDSQLRQYLHRIGYTGAVTPTLPVLRALQFAHLTHIPY